MSHVIIEATKYSGDSITPIHSTEKFFYGEVFVRDIMSNEYRCYPEKNRIIQFEIALEHNKRFLAVAPSLYLKDCKIDEDLLIDILKNSREIFPNNSFQIKKLHLDYISEDIVDTLIEINPLGLSEICFYWNRKDCSPKSLRRILSINSLKSAIITSFNNWLGLKSSNLTSLVFRTQYCENDNGLEFSLNSFPNLRSLEFTTNSYFLFSGVAKYLSTLWIHSECEIAIDFNSFPVLSDLTIILEEDPYNIFLSNEKGHLRRLNLLVFGGYQNFKAENCDFNSLRDLELNEYDELDGVKASEKLHLFLNSPIEALTISRVKNLEILKQMKALKKFTTNIISRICYEYSQKITLDFNPDKIKDIEEIIDNARARIVE